MNLEQLKRTMLISTAASLAIIGALIFAIVMEFNQWRSLQVDLTIAEEQLVQLEERLMRLNLLREQEAEVAGQLELMKKILPGEIAEQDLLREIQKTALLAGCQISEFRFGELVHQDKYTEMPFDLTLEGRFTGLVKLLDNINRVSKIYRIQEISLQSSNADGLIRADLQISSFYID